MLASRFLQHGATAKSFELSTLQHSLTLPLRTPKPGRKSVSQVPYSGPDAKFGTSVVVDTAAADAGRHVVNPQCNDDGGVSSSFDFERYLSTHTQAVNKELDAALSSLRCPERLRDAMRHYVLAGGKRACSVVAIACCELVGGAASSALPLACAIEMLVSAAFIHDDLPCMDDAPLRRGAPSCHVAFGEPAALLAGVALLALAFEHFARSDGIPADRALRIVDELASAMGVRGLAAGQVVEMENEAGMAVSLSTLEEITVRKTAWVLEAAAALGAVLGGAGDAEVERLRRYGRATGLLYQVGNDVLDVTGTTELFGKATGGDAAAGKCTFVTLMGVEGARAYADELAARADAELEGFDAARAAPLRYLARLGAYWQH